MRVVSVDARAFAEADLETEGAPPVEDEVEVAASVVVEEEEVVEVAVVVRVMAEEDTAMGLEGEERG